MRLILKLFAVVIVLALLGIGGLVTYTRATGLRSQATPTAIEARVARIVRSLAIPRADKQRTNPLAGSTEAANEGLQHFARYCALCHANNGTGQKSPIGQGLFPEPPDLRIDTQQLTDGELFYIIENGVRFTGMPAFGTGVRTEAGDRQTWQLVTFIRKLPSLTADEVGWMESLNPL
jgi:mono/diheme cytochrome c family protein